MPQQRPYPRERIDGTRLMLHALTLSVAMTAVSELAVSSEAVGESLQPIVRRVELKYIGAGDDLTWRAYCQEVDRLWVEYQATGSTDEGFAMYQAAASEAKRRYVYGDTSLPIVSA